MKIIPLSEGSFTIDNSKVFIPFDKAADDLQQRPVGSLLVEIQPFAVITERDILLLDTGLGFHTADGQMQLHKNLRDNGINPSAVTKVLMSHLHKDHAGGIENKRDKDRQPVLSFPNADYYVNKNEFSYAFENRGNSYQPDDFNLLQNSVRLKLLDDKGTVDNYIHYDMCGGHSKYHMVFRINEHEQVLFFGGDVAPQLQQMKSRFVAKYDFDGRKSMELRNSWWEQGKKEHWTFLFYHDIKTPFILL